MNIKIILFLVICLLSISNLMALEIDEKLTCRLLRLSTTKKTVLINRGLEDGLVTGDHAKFFITTGVIARGVVIKASPSRTIWAIYRMVNPSEMNVDSVVNIKIAAPVKLTNDSSRAFGRDQYDGMGNPNVQDMGNNVDLGGRSGDIPMDLRRMNNRNSFSNRGRGNINKRSDDAELKEMYASSRDKTRGTGRASLYMDDSGVNTSRDWEVWSLINLSILSTSTEDSDESVKESNTDTEFYIGMEKYFTNKNAWFGKISPVAFIHSRSKSTSTGSTDAQSYSIFELGVGAYYNFGASPFAYNKLIGFIGPTLAYGSAKAPNGTETASGKVSTLTFGGGIKYYLSWGFGIRMMLNYISETQSFTYDDTDSTVAQSGFKTFAGLSYRF